LPVKLQTGKHLKVNEHARQQHKKPVLCNKFCYKTKFRRLAIVAAKRPNTASGGGMSLRCICNRMNGLQPLNFLRMFGLTFVQALKIGVQLLLLLQEEWLKDEAIAISFGEMNCDHIQHK
jgi:hypothetical protein